MPSKKTAQKAYFDNVWIVIPAYNEETKIEGVLKKLHREGFKTTIVVDDGSKDKTFEVASKHSKFALKQPKNRGQGAALRRGINFAVDNGASIVVTFDSDGQHRPEDLKKLIEPVMKGKADVVLGSRFLSRQGTEKIPPMRRFTLRLGRIVCYVLYRIRLTDSQSGLRAFSADAAKKIKITQDRMEHAPEIFDEIMRNKLKFVEVPIVVNYTDYSLQKGQSSADAIKIGLNMLKMKFRRRK